jgi:hypothetical protein
MENKKVKEALYELSIQTDKEIVYQDEINGYVNTIQNYIERLEQALINKIEWKSAKQVLPQEWNGDTRTVSDDVLCYSTTKGEYWIDYTANGKWCYHDYNDKDELYWLPLWFTPR